MKLTETRRLSRRGVVRVKNWAMTTSGVVLVNKKDIDLAFKNKTILNFKQTVTEFIELQYTHECAIQFFKKKLAEADGCSSFVVKLHTDSGFVDVHLTVDTSPGDFIGSQDGYRDLYPVVVMYSFDF
jgi:hypothetical protein